MTDKLKTRDLKGVEIFDVGTWDASTGKVTITEEDIDELARNYEALKDELDIPVKLGHSDDQALLQKDGYPAAGWVENVRKSGTKLVADLKKVPEKIADLVEAGGYRNVSSEIWKSMTIAGKKYGQVLSAVALLGEEIPAVTTLADIVALYAGKTSFGIDQASRIQVVVYAAKPAPKDDEETDPEELLERMEEMRSRAAKATKGKRWAPAFRTLLGESIRRLREIIAVPTKAALGADEPLEKIRGAIEKALRDQYGGWPYVVETFDEYAIADRDGRYWQCFYSTAADGSIVLGESVEVERTWRPKTRTTPKNAGTSGEEEEADMATSKAIVAALGLPENADDDAVVKAIAGLKADKDQFSATTQRVGELETKLAQRDATDAVDAAIRACKVAPAQREWAEAYAQKDPEGFKTYVEKTPELFTGLKGSETDAPETQSAGVQIRELIAAARAKQPTLTFAAAMDQVTREHPELTRQYREEGRAAAARS